MNSFGTPPAGSAASTADPAWVDDIAYLEFREASQVIWGELSTTTDPQSLKRLRDDTGWIAETVSELLAASDDNPESIHLIIRWADAACALAEVISEHWWENREPNDAIADDGLRAAEARSQSAFEADRSAKEQVDVAQDRVDNALNEVKRADQALQVAQQAAIDALAEVQKAQDKQTEASDQCDEAIGTPTRATLFPVRRTGCSWTRTIRDRH